MRNFALGIVDDDEGTLYTVSAMIGAMGRTIREDETAVAEAK